MPRVVVLGTGTSVGKTFVTTALLRALAGRGLQTQGLKPIETGIEPAQLDGSQPTDSRALELASTLPPPTPHPLHAFPAPVSPHLAARTAGVRIHTAGVARWVHDTTIHHTANAWVCLETAGGALSPLGPDATNVELAAALEPAVLLLVAPDSLGVLHDLTATLAALRARLRAPDYVALSAARTPDASTGTNADELRRLRIADPIAVLASHDTSALEPLVVALLRR